MRKPITMDALRALMAVPPPPCPHHYALAPDVMASLLALAGRVDGTVNRLMGVEMREDATLPHGTWEPRNRDGTRWIDPAPTTPEPARPAGASEP